MNAPFDNRDDKIENTMSFLANYTVKHFENKKRLMYECDYPKIAAEKDTLTSSVDINKVFVAWLTTFVLIGARFLVDYYRD